jgi:hypothetical protein
VEFKQQLRSKFPVIYDTKHVALTCPLSDTFESTGLSNLFEYMRDHLNPKVESLVLNESDPYRMALFKSDAVMPCHEAGFDAFMTAIVFLGFTSASENQWSVKNLMLNPSSKSLARYQNRLNLMVMEHGTFLDLADDQQTLDRSHVYVVSHVDGLSLLGMEDLFPKATINRVYRDNDNEAYVFLSEALTSLPVIQDEKLSITSFPAFKEAERAVPKGQNKDEVPSGWCTIS